VEYNPFGVEEEVNAFGVQENENDASPLQSTEDKILVTERQFVEEEGQFVVNGDDLLVIKGDQFHAEEDQLLAEGSKLLVGDYPFRNVSLPWDERVKDLVSRLTLDEIQLQLARSG
jgi:hypothetical protein